MSSIFQSCFLCFTHIPNFKVTNQKVSYGCASVWFGTANNRQTVLGVLPAFSGKSEISVQSEEGYSLMLKAFLV